MVCMFSYDTILAGQITVKCSRHNEVDSGVATITLINPIIDLQ